MWLTLSNLFSCLKFKLPLLVAAKAAKPASAARLLPASTDSLDRRMKVDAMNIHFSQQHSDDGQMARYLADGYRVLTF